MRPQDLSPTNWLDLARGFIKGDVVSYEDYMNCYNFTYQ